MPHDNHDLQAHQNDPKYSELIPKERSSKTDKTLGENSLMNT